MAKRRPQSKPKAKARRKRVKIRDSAGKSKRKAGGHNYPRRRRVYPSRVRAGPPPGEHAPIDQPTGLP